MDLVESMAATEEGVGSVVTAPLRVTADDICHCVGKCAEMRKRIVKRRSMPAFRRLANCYVTSVIVDDAGFRRKEKKNSNTKLVRCFSLHD